MYSLRLTTSVLGLGQRTQQAVLEGRPEHRLGDWRVLGLVDSGLFVAVLWVRVVGVLPLILPAQIVWVARVPHNLIVPLQICEAFAP